MDRLRSKVLNVHGHVGAWVCSPASCREIREAPKGSRRFLCFPNVYQGFVVVTFLP